MKNKITLSFVTSLILVQNIYAKDTKQLDTVTVTAQKTEENVQDVPIAISVFDEFTLEDKMIDSIADISKYTPGFELQDLGGTMSFLPSVRGIFSSAGTNPSVGLFIDGVPMMRASYEASLLDIERIEVLKGPQGTLYGKNAETGVINVITKKPDNEIKGKIIADLGSDSKRELAFNASGPIVQDKFYIGIAGKHYEKDGFVKNTYKNTMDDDREHDYGKIHLRWTPNDDLELSLISSKIKYNEGGSNGGPNATYKEVTNDFDNVNTSDIVTHALNISYTINNNLSLTSTTTHTKENLSVVADFDRSNVVGLHMFNDRPSKTTAEELKLNYHNDNIKLVSGIYLENQKQHIDRTMIMAAATRYTTNDTEGDSLGLFSHVTYDINDRLSVLGGLRYDKVNQEFKDSTQTIDNDESEVSPKIGLTYDLKENMMTYVTISKGYRAGGFNLNALTGSPKTYNKETLYSYEVGLKGTSIDSKLSYDAAVYYMDMTDMQVGYYPDIGSYITTNAAEATSKGIEASLNFQATDTINLFASASYNDVTLDKYHDGKVDYSGNTATYASKYNFSLGATYRSSQGYYASADISGFGDMYLDLANKYKRDPYEIVNAKIGYEQEDYNIYLYAKNLFDKEYDQVGATTTTYSEPRELGVRLAYRF